MNKLYAKSELLFAIMWIVVYIVGTVILNDIASILKITNFFTPLFYILLCGILVVWIFKNKLNTKFGLCKSPFSAKYFLFFMPLVIWILAPGFDADPGKIDLTITIARIMFVYVIFVCGAAFLSAVLNAFSRFLLAAFMPVLLNIMLIGALLCAMMFGSGNILYLIKYCQYTNIM